MALNRPELRRTQKVQRQARRVQRPQSKPPQQAVPTSQVEGGVFGGLQSGLARGLPERTTQLPLNRRPVRRINEPGATNTPAAVSQQPQVASTATVAGAPQQAINTAFQNATAPAFGGGAAAATAAGFPPEANNFGAQFGGGFGISPLSPQGVNTGIPQALPFAAGAFDQRNFPTKAEIQEINKNLPKDQKLNKDTIRRQQQLGELGFILDPTKEFKKGDVPFIELGLNFSERLKADRERAQAGAIIQNALGLIGQSPESTLAREVATERLENPEFFDQEALDILTGGVKQRTALGVQDALREAQAAVARQGFGGGLTPSQIAELRQNAARSANQELADIAIENIERTDAREQAALAALQGIGSEEEARRLALTEELTQILAAERGPFDLSGLAVRGAKSPGLFHGIF